MMKYVKTTRLFRFAKSLVAYKGENPELVLDHDERPAVHPMDPTSVIGD